MDTYSFVQKQIDEAKPDHLEYAMYYKGYYLCLYSVGGLEVWKIKNCLSDDYFTTEDTFANRESVKEYVNRVLRGDK